jgi:hypothetical protein
MIPETINDDKDGESDGSDDRESQSTEINAIAIDNVRTSINLQICPLSLKQ